MVNWPRWIDSIKVYGKKTIVKLYILNMEQTEKLILDNQKLVYYLFSKNIPKTEVVDHYKDEIIGEGFLGLVKAVNLFDDSKNIKFSIFASTVILNSMRMAIRNLRKDFDRSQGLDDPLGLDSDGNSLTLADTLEGENNIEEFWENVEHQNQKELYEEAKCYLSPKQIKIIKLREKGLKQREISDKLGISQSYVARIIQSSMKKIRQKIKEIEMKQVDPNSPKLGQYDSKEVWQRDYSKYQYLKARGRLNEFVPSIITPPLLRILRFLLLNLNQLWNQITQRKLLIP